MGSLIHIFSNPINKTEIYHLNGNLLTSFPASSLITCSHDIVLVIAIASANVYEGKT